MKTLKNHSVVYDSECPMCDLYTKGFVNAGMLDESGRVAFGCARVPVSFDNQKARDQIALVDYETGTVTYGLDSLIKIIGHSFPIFGAVLRWNILRAPLLVLYSFISYNRKVIAPPDIFEKRGSCTPSYSIGYRIAYLLFTWFIASLVLTSYSSLVYPLVPHTTLYREFIICGGQILFQMVIVLIVNKERVLHYLGNMMTVSLIGALLLLPMLIVARIFPLVQPEIAVMWFGLVVTFMLVIHMRRVKKLGLHWSLSTSWVLYRLIVLWIILTA